MRRRFNVAGPCRPDWHYMIPAERRLPELPALIEQCGYVVVHAPRQTGKTTALRALAETLTAEARYAAVMASCEAGQAAGEDFGKAERIVMSELFLQAATRLPPELRPPPLEPATAGNLVRRTLAAWAQACPKPLVLLLDEIDALQGASLISVLRQLRAGYHERPNAFPASVILCGLRDVRDYKAASGGDPSRLGTSSPFNIKLKSLRIGDFTEAELRELYAQHTSDTGQQFTEEALARAWVLTRGQPWLVNALGRGLVEAMAIPAEQPVRAVHVEEAKERLILERATHLDSLVHKLMEPRVRRVMEPLLAGDALTLDPCDDDLSYARDLGLIAPENPVRVANPIYKEVIARVLSEAAEAQVMDAPSAFVLPDGRLAWRRLLRAFARFWREHGEVLSTRMPYPEAGPQLVVMAFLQRIVNGGGRLDREYGVGRGRVDLLVRFPYRKPDGTRGEQRRAVEIKVWRDGQKNPRKKGLAQLDEYLRGLRLSRGTLLIVDARSGRKKSRARFEDTTTPAGRRARVLWV